MPRPTPTDRRVGASRARQARGCSCSRGRDTRQRNAAISAIAWDRAARALAGTLRCSAPELPLLQPGQRELAEKLDLVLELDAELLVRTPPRFGHEGDRVGRRGGVCVLDEVRVLGRDLGAADPVSLEPACLEHPARAQLVLGLLEHAA